MPKLMLLYIKNSKPRTKYGRFFFLWGMLGMKNRFLAEMLLPKWLPPTMRVFSLLQTWILESTGYNIHKMKEINQFKGTFFCSDAYARVNFLYHTVSLKRKV